MSKMDLDSLVRQEVWPVLDELCDFVAAQSERDRHRSLEMHAAKLILRRRTVALSGDRGPRTSDLELAHTVHGMAALAT